MKKTETDYENPSDDFVGAIPIGELLPQQPPFVMVDRLVHYDAGRVVSETTVDEANIYVENGVMQAYGLIENIAQTCAARIGYINKYIRRKGIDIGFIGALKDLSVEDLPRVGETLTTEVVIQCEVGGMTLASARLAANGKTLIETALKIAIKEEQI